MKFRKFFHTLGAGMMGSMLGTALSSANILVGLDPATALYDSDVKGIINDASNGPGTPGNLSGVPLIDNAAPQNHSQGFTFNVAFTPTAADLSGTRLLIEIGGLSNGSGLYLIGGVPTLASKQGSAETTVPESLNDRALNAIAVQSSIGKLEAGVAYSLSASWNQSGTLELKAAADGGAEIFNSFAISGTPGNWSGNDTLGVKTIASGNLGGLAKAAATNAGSPFANDVTASFQGVVSRALFWGANAVTPLTLTAPVLRGLSVTEAPVEGEVRLHWNVSEGGLPNPTTIVIRDAAGNVLWTPASLTGFKDIATTATDFSITATNANGEVSSLATLEPDTPFSAVVRADQPLAWYRFNESSGSQLIVDSAANSAPHDGLVLGDPVSGDLGFIDKAASFQSAGAISTDLILNPGSFTPVAVEPVTPRTGFTIEAVIKRAAGAAGNHTLISQTDVGGTGRVILAIGEDGTIYNQLPGGGAGRKTADEKLPPEAWSHLVVVVDAGTVNPGTAETRWYLDGKKIGSSLDGLNPDLSTFDPNLPLETSLGSWIIGSGKNLGSDFWKGKIDDIAIYQNLLDDPNGDGDVTDSRIADHRNAWRATTSGILYFGGSSPVVNTGGPLELVVKVGADADTVSINNGIGNVPVVDGTARITLFPTATTTYQATAAGAGGTYTADFTVTYQQLTLPVILGYEATSLPGSNQVRLHWSVSAGAFPTPVTIQLKSGATLLQETGSLKGYFDIDVAAAQDLSLTAANFIGPVSATAVAPAADSPFSVEVRADSPSAWFRFNEATGSKLVVDSAENPVPHDGATSGVSVKSGASGFLDGAATFSGGGANATGVVTDRILDQNALLAGYTVEAIVRNEPLAAGTNRVLFSQQDLNGTGRQIVSVDDNGVIRSNVGGGIRKDADQKLLPKKWSHLVAIVDLITSEVRWYLDGQYAGTSKDGVNPDGTLFDPTVLFLPSDGAWVIGAAKDLAGSFWKGQIDDLIVYDKILDEDADGETDVSRVVAHHNAWFGQTSGLLYSGVSATAVDPGGSVELTLKLGADATSVEIDNGVGTVPVLNGGATVTLTPAATTTYQITVNGVVSTITITVNGSVPTAGLQLLSSSLADGNFTLNFQGSPSTEYLVRGSVDLASFPIDHGTVTTDSSGAGSAVIVIDAGKPSEFFRIESKP